MSTTIESLQVEVQSTAASAVSGIDALASTLGKLKSATKCGVGLTAVAKQLTTLNNALNGISSANADNLNKLAQGLQTLSSCGNLKLSSSVATQITNIGTAVNSISGTNFSALAELATGLGSLSGVGKSNLNSFISQLQRLPQAVQALESVSMSGLDGKLTELVSALSQLSSMGKNNLTSFVTQLNKIPKLMENLKNVDMRTLYNQIQSLVRVFTPLATQMEKVSAGFAAFPTRIQRLIANNERLATSNTKTGTSYANLAAKIGIAYVALTRISRIAASWIVKSNEYVENLNLFTVSMGKYAEKAQRYAESVAEIIGIDPAEWLRNQGIFMTLATGFGVISDRAHIMSQNLTQLGYDLSSFFNISFADSMQKLQSGIAGELEPLRRLGYDLSVARLQQEALNLGIAKSVNAMTQAEKAELRYYAIMTQVTTAQGDMSRTLVAPANQLRILQAQVTQCARALGNIFIPALNAVLPYAIALAKGIRLVADVIASLFGFSLPEIDYSGLKGAVGGAEDVADGLGDATKKAKELKNALLGIDELNVIGQTENSYGGAGIGGGGSGLGFELPTYDFIGDAVSSKADEILQKIREWLGLTEKIDTWSEVFHTRLGRILTTIGAIGLGIAAWKISKGFLTGLDMIKRLIKNGLGKPLLITAGISLAITGIALETSGIVDTIQNELNGMNFAQILSGGGYIIASGTLIGKAFGGALLGGGIGTVIAGIPAFITGIYDSLKNGIDWLSAALTAAGSTAAGFGIGAICAAAGTAITPGIGTLIGLAVGLVVDGIILVVQKWDVITEFLSNFFTVTVPNLWGKFTSWLSNIPKQLGTFFKTLPGKIANWFDKLWQPIRDYDWKNLGYKIGQWFGNAVKGAINFVTVTVPNWFADLWDTIKSGFKKFFTETLPKFFTETIPNVVAKIGEFFKELPKKIYTAFISAKEWLVDIGSAIIDGIWEGLQSIWKAITDFVDGFIQGFKDALGIHSPSTVFAEIGGNIVDGLLQGIKSFTDMLSTVKEWAGSVVEWFVKGKDGKGIVESFKEIGGNIISGFKDKIGSTYNTVKTNITTWATNVKDWFTNSSFGGVNRENFAMFANNIIEGFRNKVSTTFINVKSSIITWAVNVKNWFSSSSFGGVNGSTFLSYASNIIDGFKSGVSSYYDTVKSVMTTFAFNVKRWFERPDGSSLVLSFINIGKNIIQGFIDGVSSLWDKAMNIIKDFGASIISSGKKGTEEHSPSKAFKQIGCFAIEGFNIGIRDTMGSSFKLMSEWANGITSYEPTVGFAVDTASLKYFDSASFTKSLSANVSAVSSYAVENSFSQEAVRDAVLQALNDSNLAGDMHRQANKNEQTNVYVGNRVVSDAVTTQQKANGYVFAR